MRKYWKKLSISQKILLPIIIVSLISGGFSYWYFYNLYKDAEVNALVSKARTLVIEAEAVRDFTAKQLSSGIFSNDLQDQKKVLLTVPIYSAITVIKEKAKDLNMDFKVPKFHPRNPDNEPDAFETQILKKLEAGTENEYWEINEATNNVRFFRPIKLTEECLRCHGDPEKSFEYWGRTDGKDITGAKMENWKTGEVHGAFEILMSMKPVQALVAQKSLVIALISVISVGFIILIGLFISKNISKPLQKLECIATKVALGEADFKIEVDTEDEIGKLEKSFNVMLKNIKEQAEIANCISKGNLDIEVHPKSNKDVLSHSLARVVDTAKNLIKDLNDLTCAALSGHLKVRIEESKYQGKYFEIVNGVNKTIDAFIDPINESSVTLAQMAGGDLTARMTGSYKGDFEILKSSINKLGSSLSDLITQVTQAVHATASAANQISSSAEEMAAGAQHQSTQTSEVAVAMEEMTKTILETTKNTEIASIASKQAGEIAKNGGSIVQQTIKGIQNIDEVVSKSAETVYDLGKNSDQIGEIAQVIDDIADQTNLLALNAAIEAARAGEQGRGFAVVADEVRKLAERTTKATKEIADMIRKIQSDTSGAVVSMNKGKDEVEKGKQFALKAGQSLNEIISAAQNVGDIISQVAAASEQQSSTAEQISKNIDSINSIIHESAQGVQQIATASEDLSRLTLRLQEMVAQFKVDKTASDFAVRQNGKIVKK